MSGQVQKKNILVLEELTEPPVLPINPNPFKRCCYNLEVFADDTDTSVYKNDYFGALEAFPLNYTSVTKNLQKLVDGLWITQAVLNDNTYGTNYALGFETKNNKNYVGYKLQWRTVLIAFGTGKYRIQFDTPTIDLYSYDFCLNNYTADAVDRTVRITYLWDSVIGSKSQAKVRDFAGMEWLSQMRISSSMFGFKKAPFTVESTKYATGKEVSYKKTAREEYKLEIVNMPNDICEFLYYDILQADDIWMTDYNSTNNSGSYIEHNVEINGAYDPNYGNLRPELSLDIPFIDKYNNRDKKYS